MRFPLRFGYAWKKSFSDGYVAYDLKFGVFPRASWLFNVSVSNGNGVQDRQPFQNRAFRLLVVRRMVAIGFPL